MSYYGFRLDVYRLMQTLSHQSRAFITNANGLKGFIQSFDLTRFLEIAEGEKFEEANRYQHVDKKFVVEILKEINS